MMIDQKLWPCYLRKERGKDKQKNVTQFQREKERGWYHEEQSTVDSGSSHVTAGSGHRRVTSNGHFYFVLLTNASGLVRWLSG